MHQQLPHFHSSRASSLILSQFGVHSLWKGFLHLCTSLFHRNTAAIYMCSSIQSCLYHSDFGLLILSALGTAKNKTASRSLIFVVHLFNVVSLQPLCTQLGNEKTTGWFLFESVSRTARNYPSLKLVDPILGPRGGPLRFNVRKF